MDKGTFYLLVITTLMEGVIKRVLTDTYAWLFIYSSFHILPSRKDKRMWSRREDIMESSSNLSLNVWATSLKVWAYHCVHTIEYDIRYIYNSCFVCAWD